MSGLISGFNANDVPLGIAIPAKTKAVCLVTEMEDRQAKNNPDNWYIAATIEVVEGEYKGWRVFHIFNIKNDNEKALTIGTQYLAQLLLAVGCPRPQSNNDLLNKPVLVTFGKPQEFNGEMQSRISKFEPVGGSDGVTQNLGPGAGAGAAKKPAWATK